MRIDRPTAFASLTLLVLAATCPADEPKKPQGPANRLAKETSPYLLLHAHNPVDWYPWGPEAFAKAKAENKPIFLSIGYSSCYWCHVMERESFMDPAIAKAINAGFVAIKVDREERPDVDQVYMTAVQAFSGSGGWPMSVFLTPDGRPFFGGTYFPRRLHRPAQGRRRGLAGPAARDREGRRRPGRRRPQGFEPARRPGDPGPPDPRTGRRRVEPALAEQFDPEFGGFNFDPARPKRPKFPEPVNLVYLLDQDRAATVASGSRRDEAPTRWRWPSRPSTRWPGAASATTWPAVITATARSGTGAVPHFEKMLYDNAQLAEGSGPRLRGRTGDPRWKAEAEATFAFVAKTLTSPGGLFYSSLDAESEGEEGKSYLWTPAEVKKILGDGDDYTVFAHAYALDGEPDLDDGRYVLLMPRVIDDPALEARLAPLRAKVLEARNKRPAPSLDDKILTSWNALMIAAYAEAGRVLKDERYKLAAGKAADVLLALMAGPDGRLLRTSRNGQAKLAAYLEDYGALTYALVRLHAATSDPNRLTQAKKLADRMIADFADRKDGGFFYTAGDHEALLARVKDPFDNAVPGANSLAIRALVGLGVASGEARYLDEAGRALEAFAPSLRDRPSGSPLMLLALEEYLDARPPSSKSSGPSDAPLPGAPGVVNAKANSSNPLAIAPGEAFEVELTLTIQDRYHIYANPAGSDDVIPTVITLEPGSKAELVEVRYPKGESKVLAANGPGKVTVFEKSAAPVAKIRLPLETPTGTATIHLRIRYQACDDKACLAPATLDVPVSVEVKGK